MTVEVSRTLQHVATGLSFEQVVRMFAPPEGNNSSFTYHDILKHYGFGADSTVCLPIGSDLKWDVRVARELDCQVYFIDPEFPGRGWYLLRARTVSAWSVVYPDGIIASAWSNANPDDMEDLVWELRLQLPIGDVSDRFLRGRFIEGFERAIADADVVDVVAGTSKELEDVLRERGENDVVRYTTIPAH